MAIYYTVHVSLFSSPSLIYQSYCIVSSVDRDQSVSHARHKRAAVGRLREHVLQYNTDDLYQFQAPHVVCVITSHEQPHHIVTDLHWAVLGVRVVAELFHPASRFCKIDVIGFSHHRRRPWRTCSAF